MFSVCPSLHYLPNRHIQKWNNMLYMIAFISNVGLMRSGPSLFEQ